LKLLNNNSLNIFETAAAGFYEKSRSTETSNAQTMRQHSNING